MQQPPPPPPSAAAAYELPDGLAEEDQTLLHNVLTALQALGHCARYKVQVTQVGFLVRGALHSDEAFEVDSDDLFFVMQVSPLRVERVLVARAGGRSELVVKVLNCSQRVMVTGAATFTACKKRRLTMAQAPA